MLQSTDVELPRHRSCAAIARRHVEQFASGELTDHDLADLKLVVCELVDNAYLHGKGRIWLKLDRAANGIRVEVIDEGEGAAVNVRPTPTPTLEHGHGLRIVDQLATRWGAFEGTTHVWAGLPIIRARG
jgi:anti-sigma regulatory factor (Ser/Thr protein kinase)